MTFTGILRSLVSLAEMGRPAIGAIAAGGAVTGLLVLDPGTGWLPALLVGVSVLTVTAGGFVLNDVADLEKDRICHPQRVLPSGRTSRGMARAWGAALMAAGLATALPLGRPAAALVACNVLLLAIYARLRLLDGFLGNLATSYLAASTVLLVSLVAGEAAALLPWGVAVFFLMLGRELVFDLRDLAGDRAAGIRTLASRVGAPATFFCAWAALAILGVTAVQILLRTGPATVGGLCLILALVLAATALAGVQLRPSDGAYRRFVALTRWSFVLLVAAFGLLARTGS